FGSERVGSCHNHLRKDAKEHGRRETCRLPCHPWRRDAMDHGTITQNGQVEAIAVEVTSCGASSAIFSQNSLINCFSVRSPTWMHLGRRPPNGRSRGERLTRR